MDVQFAVSVLFLSMVVAYAPLPDLYERRMPALLGLPKEKQQPPNGIDPRIYEEVKDMLMVTNSSDYVIRLIARRLETEREHAAARIKAEREHAAARIKAEREHAAAQINGKDQRIERLVAENKGLKVERVYTHDDIRSIVEYARVRGIRVVPEFDAPAHVGEGWPHLAKPGENVEDYVVCFRAEPWRDFCVEPPCGQLNPTSDKVYDVLEGIYTEMNSLFDSDLFHMGGDEVNMNCWNSTESIVQWMSEKNLGRSDDDFHELWNVFQERALQRLETVNNGKQKPILWTSSFTTEARLKRFLDPKKYIVQIWTTGTDQTVANLVKNGYPVIFSNYDALYLDCGFGAWVGEGNNWCSPFIPWQKVYDNDPMEMLAELNVNVNSASTRKLVLGAEAALWSEQADEKNMDARLWPRVAAMAERLWSNPKEGWRGAELRFLHHRELLLKRGVSADSTEPEWCYQNEGSCYL